MAKMPPSKAKTKNPVVLNMPLNSLSINILVLYLMLLVFYNIISVFLYHFFAFLAFFKVYKRFYLFPRFSYNKLIKRSLKKIQTAVYCIGIDGRIRYGSWFFFNL